MSRLSTSTSSSVAIAPTTPRAPTTTAFAGGSTGRGSGSVPNTTLPRADTTHPLSAQMRALVDTVNGNTVTLGNILLEQRRMMDAITELQHRSFSIERSVFKDGLLRSVGLLFCTTITRNPSQQAIKIAVNSVLRNEAEVKYKFEAAVSFCKSRISEMRAEERRRIFGLSPCQSFSGIRIEEFVTKFLPVVKVERHSIPKYHLHVAILRRYCRTVELSTKNTYKGFERWLESSFVNGNPSDQDLELIYAEEEGLLTPALQPNSPSPHDDPEN